MRNIFAGRIGIIVVGAVIGVIAALLQYFGNPPNMGICVACFERDIAGALGLHRADVVQYLRPEIMGFVVGAFFAAILAGEYKPRGGSSPPPPRPPPPTGLAQHTPTGSLPPVAPLAASTPSRSSPPSAGPAVHRRLPV